MFRLTNTVKKTCYRYKIITKTVSVIEYHAWLLQISGEPDAAGGRLHGSDHGLLGH